MLTLAAKATPDSEVVATELGNGEVVLLHLGTQAYYTLNTTGSQIWEMINQGHTFGEISQAIEAKYDVSLDHAQQSVFTLAQELMAAQLLSIEPAQNAV